MAQVCVVPLKVMEVQVAVVELTILQFLEEQEIHLQQHLLKEMMVAMEVTLNLVGVAEEPEVQVVLVVVLYQPTLEEVVVE